MPIRHFFNCSYKTDKDLWKDYLRNENCIFLFLFQMRHKEWCHFFYKFLFGIHWCILFLRFHPFQEYFQGLVGGGGRDEIGLADQVMVQIGGH